MQMYRSPQSRPIPQAYLWQASFRAASTQKGSGNHTQTSTLLFCVAWLMVLALLHATLLRVPLTSISPCSQRWRETSEEKRHLESMERDMVNEVRQAAEVHRQVLSSSIPPDVATQTFRPTVSKHLSMAASRCGPTYEA